jgi:multiple sugar transport system permease protein
MFDGDYGLISQIWQALGGDPLYILADRHWAYAAVLTVIVWKYFGFHMMLYIAGLQTIDRNLYEAAAIDGASPIQAFFKLTLPMLTKIIAIAVLIRGVDLFRTFDYIKVMTEGGPGTATETLTAYAGTIYFKNADFPYASTIALFTLILVVVTSSAFIKIFKVKF